MDLTGKTPEEIQELVDDQEKKLLDNSELINKQDEVIAAKDEQIEALNGIIANVKTQTVIDVNTAQKEVPEIPAEPFEFEGKTYQWQKARFRLMGDINAYTAAQASKDEAVLKKLLAIDGQQILKELA